MLCYIDVLRMDGEAQRSRGWEEESGRNILMMGQIRETTGGIRGIQ